MKQSLKEYKKQYYLKNRDRLLKLMKENNNKNKLKKTEYDKEYYKNNKIKKVKQSKEYNLKNRENIKIRKDSKKWQESCYHAKQRCTNVNCKDYKNYGGRGIKFLMSSSEFKFLWFRDKAYNMEQPTIDREENDGNYELSNCRFMERSENTSRRFR